MKFRTSVAAFLVLAIGLSTANAQLYWDTNDTGTGATNDGGGVANGTWGIDNFWTGDPDGLVSTGPWSGGSLAVFSAGTNAIGASTVTVDGTQSVSGINFDEGAVTLTGGTIDVGGSGILNAASGITGTINSSLSGSINVLKQGDGTVVLGADNTTTFTGGFEVQNGTLHATHIGALGVPSDFTPLTVQSGGTLRFSGSGLTFAQPAFISGNGFNNTGALRKTGGGVVTLSGGFTLNAASRIQSEQGTLTISGQPLVGTNTDLTISGSGATTISANIQTGAGKLIKEGSGKLTLSSNGNSWTGGVDIRGGTITIPSISGCPNCLGTPTGNTITLDGGTLENTNPGVAGSFVSSLRTLQITSNGGGVGVTGAPTIHAAPLTLAPGTDPDLPTTVLTVNAGAGMTGDFGTPAANHQMTKLVVKNGNFRLRTGATDLTFGRAPASFMADAITLDGGGIGSALNITLHANRGITIGPSAAGGRIAPSAGITMTVPGAVSGSGKLVSGLTTGAGGTTVLSSADNITTFTGSVEANRAVLRLSASLNATNLSGGFNGTSAADIDINGGAVVFTVGSDNTSTMFPGRLLGSGRFRKIGTGTLTLDSVGTGNLINMTSANANAFVIDGGTVAFGTVNLGTPGFNAAIAGTLAVKINNGTFNMTALPAAGTFTHSFGSLLSDTGITTGSLLMGTNIVTLGQTATTNRSYEGTITSTGGTLTKAGSTFTQTLAGNNTLAAVNVNAGRLDLNGTNTTGIVTVNSGGTLGGTGSVSGDVIVNAGSLAPGTSIGTLTMGGLTLNTGSVLNMELGAPSTSDLLNVTVLDGLNIAGSSTINLTDAGGFAPGNYTLIDYAGTLGGSFSNLTVGTTPDPGFTYNLVNTGSTIDLSVVAAPTNDADFNGDGVIDAADWAVWQKFNPIANPNGTQETGDADGDLDVDSADETVWQSTFGDLSPGAGGGAGGGGAVPEPSTVAMLIIALSAMASRRRGR